MKILSQIKGQMSALGYRKSGDSFWRVEKGFYQLIHFQKGGFGNYFFLNAALHPVGLPLLQMGAPVIPERPKEYECALRTRAERISPQSRAFLSGPGFPEDGGILPDLLSAVLPDIAAWQDTWGSCEALLQADFEPLTKLFSAVPILWRKEFYLLKCYCACMLRQPERAGEYFEAYRQENTAMDLSPLDEYMTGLLNRYGNL